MTDRVRTVALTDDFRVDDLARLVDAIVMIRGVESVTLGAPLAPNDWAARTQVRRELEAKLYEVLRKQDDL